MAGGHTYKLLQPRAVVNKRLEVIEYDENGNPWCYYIAYYVPWVGFKLYPAYCKSILNREERKKTIPEQLVRR